MQTISTRLILISMLIIAACYLFTMDFPSIQDFKETLAFNNSTTDVKAIAIGAMLLGPIIMIGLGLLPFVMLYKSVQKFCEKPKSVTVLNIANIALVAGYVFVFYSVFWFNDRPDAQDGIVLVFIPFIAILFAVVASVVAGLVNRLA